VSPGYILRWPPADNMLAMENSPSKLSRLSVSIVLHHSCLEMLQRVLRSLHRSASVAHTAGCVGEVRVEVLDNSFDPNFRERAHRVVKGWPINDFFRVVYKGLQDNRGFGAGHNMTIPKLHSEFHLVLNPDAELAEDALLVRLSSLQEDQSIVLPRCGQKMAGRNFSASAIPPCWFCCCDPLPLDLFAASFASGFTDTKCVISAATVRKRISCLPAAVSC